MIDAETHAAPTKTAGAKATGKQKKITPPPALPREKKQKPLQPNKLKAAANPEDDSPIWKALNWNQAGGKEAKQYPYVVSKKNEAPATPEEAEQIHCLAGDSGRLLRFMSEGAAQSRANYMNRAATFARNQTKLF